VSSTSEARPVFKFLHAADLHLDSPLQGLERYEGAPTREIRGATRRALENLVRLAIDEEARFVLIAGDLYDGDWKDYSTALFLSRQMSRLREAGVRVFIISGNHDAVSRITRSLRLPENVKQLSTRAPETVVLEDLGVAIHGQGFAERAVTEDLSAAYPSALPGLFNIGMLHTAANGREGHEPYAPCRLEGLLSKKYDYWALGHVHRREVLHRDPWVVFPGNTQGRHINETGPKGCSLVTVDRNGCLSLEHRNLNVIEWALCEVEADRATIPEHVVDLVRRRVDEIRSQVAERMVAVRVVVRGASAAHQELTRFPERWNNEIRSAVTDSSCGAAWIEKICLKTRTPMKLEELMARDDVVADMLRALKEAGSETGSIAALKEEFLALGARLPAELFELQGAVRIRDDSGMETILEDARDFLITRLLEGGADQ
jgi:exonuclease SbcD